MGAVTFSIDPRLVACLKEALPLTVFVETGTFRGDSLAEVVARFDESISIEASEALWREAVERFAAVPRVQVLRGDSPQVLKELREHLLGSSTLFWLDAHWCVAANTAGETSQCPLLAEIEAIGRLPEHSVVLIDDARLFLAPPPEPHDVAQWPLFADVVNRLRALSAAHELMVVNDVIAFYPKAARTALVGYARMHGVDWLHARQAQVENEQIRGALEEKEEFIQRQDAMLLALHRDRSIRALVGKVGGYLSSNSVAAGELRRREDVGDEKESIDSIREEFDARYLEAMRALEEKEAAIGALCKELNARDERIRAIKASEAALALANAQAPLPGMLEEKERVIQELRRALDAYRAAHPLLKVLGAPIRVLMKLCRRVFASAFGLMRPRLGNLNQHGPIDLRIPAHYSDTKVPRNAPRISIVTPSYGQAAFIERTIRSVLDQSYPDLEYFIQDGGSRDGTVEILRRYEGRLSGWQSVPDDGQSCAINLGMANTTGEIMAWLNSDDVLLPGALAYVANYFEKHPDVDVVYGHRILIDENDKQIGRWILPAHDDQVLSWADFVPQETLFWRRRLWDKVGGRIDESFRFAMDWDLLLRMRNASAKFVRVPRALGAFRIHTQQKTSAVISQIGFEEMDRLRTRALSRIPTPTQIKKALAIYLLKSKVADLLWRVRGNP
jgi:hypothetical protein